jgi:hypothetical protein
MRHWRTVERPSKMGRGTQLSLFRAVSQDQSLGDWPAYRSRAKDSIPLSCNQPVVWRVINGANEEICAQSRADVYLVGWDKLRLNAEDLCGTLIQKQNEDWVRRSWIVTAVTAQARETHM